jgi:hypothetical protein
MLHEARRLRFWDFHLQPRGLGKYLPEACHSKSSEESRSETIK